MGRKKIDIKFVRNRDCRNVTFSKRKNGLIKKASELSILCGSRIGLSGYTPGGNLFAFGSPTFEVVTNEFLNEENYQLGGESSKQIGGSPQIGRINELNQRLNDLNQELMEKGKDPIDLDAYDFEGLQKVNDSLKVLQSEIDAAASLLALANRPIQFIKINHGNKWGKPKLIKIKY
ncbi:agamous-like MADS-box protein AGL29 [Cicer arietinum]|uniref:Agamous-like MADS-box protein AGL29 n=1 Tax=Cicer arietinum TaxID=3827 RepID=A0A1S2YHK3_CICAR|nr:agamous-like MADS-box protein AGL29 [Cicer arietinum]